MGESTAHIRLVRILVDWISNSFFDGDHGLVLIDEPNANQHSKPPIVYDFIPDVLVPYHQTNPFIIGEAKTAKDIETKHTTEQIAAFLRKCNEYDNSIFVFAVPWYMERLAKSIVMDIKAAIGASNVRAEVLEQLPG